MVASLINDSALTSEITAKCKKIFPVQNFLIRKVKSIKRPRFDMTQLLAMHQAQPVVVPVEKTEEKKEEKAE